jgi:hypothetical protein
MMAVVLLILSLAVSVMILTTDLMATITWSGARTMITFLGGQA